jgi:antitoxin component of RelBE/YafQ-DinJ toxin-antitoxin module
MGPEIVVPLGAFATAIICAIGIPLSRAFARKMDAEAKNPRLPLDVTNRLERMDQALEAIAIEVERISEGQRFTTRLLSEGRPGEARQISSPSSSPGRSS